ncbi:hypothetical protein K435DRAFT_772806 [Dendrothele bispora CBS 962.96]|uniref:F5/8 type C domain-containing protein n=1 Tax=Dendrothele bispora (strain CBS 962.96) TaxID=1314807 RepID=A0A4S8MUX2_DENBC|nr:hypothetical protein K435DRAFT_772806 [Dendrothele bispora CBS 962.96]
MSSTEVSLITSETTIKVSSTLDKTVGKKHLIDGSPETCWTSQQGLPQWISLTFPSSITPTRVSLTFQGGFVGRKCAVYYKPSASEDQTASIEKESSWVLLTTIYPEDVNRKQSFSLTSASSSNEEKKDLPIRTSQIKLTFEESSDFFGRITVYDLSLEGLEG